MNLLFFDTETTGKGDDAKVIQFAGRSTDGLEINQLFDPGKPIDIGAMAVHHITDEDVKGQPSFSDFIPKLNEISKTHVMVAHNAPFDVGRIVFEGADKPEKVIDTLKISKHVDQSLESHSLQYLRYYFGLRFDERIDAHDAMSDVIVLEGVFKELAMRFCEKLKISFIDSVFLNSDWKEMIEYSKKPLLLEVCPFGKYKGKRICDIRPSYLMWALANIEDMDEDLRYTFNHYLGKA